jgi:hypothetical protein
MKSVEELERAIRELPPEQFAELRRWFAELDAPLWDRQLEVDAASGRLDSLVEEASDDYRAGRTRPL